jgi:putative membrane protein
MQKLSAAWVAVFAIVFVWSGIGPKDTVTWMLEVAPAVAGATILLATRRRFPLTRLAYVLILVHCVILMIGGHYTYAEVPIGDWFSDFFDPPRNNYDKLGHLAQGFVPAIVAREVVIRLDVFNSAAWRNFFVVCFCLAVSVVGRSRRRVPGHAGLRVGHAVRHVPGADRCGTRARTVRRRP